MCHVRRRREMYARFWWGNLKEANCREDRQVDGRTILKRIFSR